VRDFLRDWPITWLNVEGLGDVEVIRQLADIFGLHWLALEDVLQVDQRAKVEQYGDHHFILPEIRERRDAIIQSILCLTAARESAVLLRVRLRSS